MISRAFITATIRTWIIIEGRDTISRRPSCATPSLNIVGNRVPVCARSRFGRAGKIVFGAGIANAKRAFFTDDNAMGAIPTITAARAVKNAFGAGIAGAI